MQKWNDKDGSLMRAKCFLAIPAALALLAAALLSCTFGCATNGMNDIKPADPAVMKAFREEIQNAANPPTGEEAVAVGEALLIADATPEQVKEALGEPLDDHDGTLLYIYRPGSFLELVFSPQGILLAKGPFRPLGVLTREGALDPHNSPGTEIRRLRSQFGKWEAEDFRIFEANSLAYDTVTHVMVRDSESRWRCIEAAIGWLRDDGLREFPKSSLIMEGIARLFLDGIGGGVDDQHAYCQHRWALMMQEIVGDRDAQNVAEWARNPQSAVARALREKLKMDRLDIMLDMEKDYGKFDWRLPGAHAIYWATLAAEVEKDPHRLLFDCEDVKRQGIQQTLKRGRIAWLPADPNRQMVTGPDLSKVAAVDALYTEQLDQKAQAEKKGGKPFVADRLRDDHVQFLEETEFYLYFSGYVTKAEKYHRTLRTLYGRPEPYVDLKDAVMRRVQKLVDECSSPERVQPLLESCINQACFELCARNLDDARFLENFARAAWEAYCSFHEAEQRERTRLLGMPALPKFQEILRQDVRRILSWRVSTFPKELSPVLRDKLKMPAGADPETLELNGPLVPPIPPDSPLPK